MRAIGNKCAPYRDKLRGVLKNCGNIGNINSGFVSCEVDYIVIFLSGKTLGLRIKKKYRRLYIQKTRAQRHLLPSWSATFLFPARWRKRYLVISTCSRLSMILSCLIWVSASCFCSTAGHMAFQCCLKKQRCMKNGFPGLHWGLYMVLHMWKPLYVARAQAWIIYSSFIHL